MVVGAPWVPGRHFVGFKWNADIILKFDQNRGEMSVILSYFLLPETWCGAFYRQKYAKNTPYFLKCPTLMEMAISKKV